MICCIYTRMKRSPWSRNPQTFSCLAKLTKQVRFLYNNEVLRKRWGQSSWSPPRKELSMIQEEEFQTEFYLAHFVGRRQL